MPVNNLLQIRRGTQSQWNTANPVLASGEPGHDITNNILKVGDGINNWNSLKSVLDINGNASISGLLNATSGNFVILEVNGTPVSVSGHAHVSNDITNFNTSVSGLLPRISNSGDNRVLTSTGSTVGVNAESNLTFDGSLLSVSGTVISNSGIIDYIETRKVQFDTDTNGTLSAGQLGWNSTAGTLDLGLTDTYALHVGEETHFRVRNLTGDVLYKGQAVYATGIFNDNQRLLVDKYAANGTVREIRFIGLMTESVSNNQSGYTTNFGYIKGVDTRGNVASNIAVGDETWAVGDILYVHPTVAGKLTKSEPKHSISVAIILYVHQNNGLLLVRPTSYGHLDDIHDVSISGATNGQFLQYNSSTDYWVPSSSGNFTSLSVNNTTVSVSGHNHLVSDITDFNSSVSGLLPTIANDGDNRVLTSTGSSTGTNAEANLVFDGSRLGINTSSPSGNLHVIGSGIISSITGIIPNATMHIYSAVSGNTIFNVEGTNGSLFSVDDNLTGTLMSVNNNAGLPVFEVFSDDRVIAGRFNQNDFVINSSGNIGIGNSGDNNYKLNVIGNTNISGVLSVNAVNVSISGHTHTSSDIIDFDSGVSSLLPTILNSGDNRLLTSTGSSVGINAENNLTFDGSTLNIDGDIVFNSFTESLIDIGNSNSEQTINIGSGTVQSCMLTDNCSFIMPSSIAGKSFTMFLNTGSGNFTASFSGVLWAGGASPTITTSSNKVDIISFISDGSNWYGNYSQNY